MLRILGRVTSINVRKVLWAADELGVAYEREDWGLPLRDPHDPEFLKLNPNALVPVLVDDEFVLWESHAIIRYLAERGGGTLIPSELEARALMDQWMTWQLTELGPSWRYAFLALGRPTPGFDDQSQIARSIGNWSDRMRILDAHLTRLGPYIVGDRLTLADIALGVAIHRWVMTPFDKPALPAAMAYYEALRARPAAAPYLGEKTP